MKRGTVLIMAGGTGGHVFPALAAARVLRERGFEPVWLGTERGLEARLVPPAQISMEWISFSGVRGKGIATLLLAPFRLLRAVKQSIEIIKRRKPDVVLGAGGFVSGPGGIAAWLLKKPLVIHEQNAVLGRVNRLVASRVKADSLVQRIRRHAALVLRRTRRDGDERRTRRGGVAARACGEHDGCERDEVTDCHTPDDTWE